MSTQAHETYMIPASEIAMSQRLSTNQVLSDWAEAVIEALPTASDDELVQHILDSNELMEKAFWIRGTAAHVAATRIKERGGRIGEEMARVAKLANVATKTLCTDRAIIETFGIDLIRSEQRLGREHFKDALAAPDPIAAIDMASVNKADNPSYSTRDFRADVQELNGGKSIEKVSEGKWRHLKLTDEEDQALEYLMKRRDLEPARAVGQACIEAAEVSR